MTNSPREDADDDHTRLLLPSDFTPLKPSYLATASSQLETSVVGNSAIDGAVLRRENLEGDAHFGETYDPIPRAKRQLGFYSAVFLIFNRIIGTGIYATPSIILRSAGSVGVALLMWLLGALIAAAGTAVFVELGTGLPRSGGEKNYLEYIYRRPKFLMSCLFAVHTLTTGSGAANSVVFGEYVTNALSLPPTRSTTRIFAFICLSLCCFIHGTFLKFGLRLQNTLGVLKLFVLSSVAILGILCLAGFSAFQVKEGYEVPRNFVWKELWKGSGTGANAFVMGLYNVIWSFVGYSNANYALSEIRDPVRTIKRAAPVAVLTVAIVYFLVNIAYFSVVSKTDILESKRIVAALFFRNLYGPTTERALSGFIALSTFGNLLAGQFGQGRVIQELGREGIVPYSSFVASNKPFNAPLTGLFIQYLISCTFMIAPPAGDVYLFMISLSSYTSALINMLVSLGVLLLYTKPYKLWDWNPPFRAPKAVIVAFCLSNVFLVVVPWIPPAPGSRVYERLPYWSHALVAMLTSLIGLLYWYVWSVKLPERNGYKLEREWVLQDDGVSRFVFRKVVPVL